MEKKLDRIQIRETFQLFVRRLGLLQKDSAPCCRLSFYQSHIVYELGKTPNLSLNELTKILCADVSTVSRQVQKLVELELVDRKPDSKDRRYVVLSLTPFGMEKHLEVTEFMQTFIDRLFANIPQDLHLQVEDSLRILTNSLLTCSKSKEGK